MLNQFVRKFRENPGFGFVCVYSFLILYQVAAVFQGFDVCDTGFAATFYQNILHAPASVESNFVLWLSGMVGGIFVDVFPSSGLLGIRLLGVMTQSLVVLLTYMLLRKHIDIVSLCFGLVLVVFSFASTAKEFNHNQLTSLIFVASTYFLFIGLKQESNLYVTISGFLVGLNVFARLPNVTNVGLLIIIVLHSYLHRYSLRICIKKAVVFVAGFIAAVLSVLVVMYILGHLDIFLSSLNRLGDVATNSRTHGIVLLIKSNIYLYMNLAVVGFSATGLIVLIAISLKMLNRYINRRILSLLIVFVCAAFMSFFPLMPLMYFISIFIIGSCLNKMEKDLLILCIMGIFMLVVLPLGSHDPISSFGHYALWIAIPLAIHMIITSNFVIIFKSNTSIQNEEKHLLNIDSKSIVYVTMLFFTVLIFKLFLNNFSSTYFDSGSRLHKKYSINSPRAKYIYTTKERADIINDLLVGIKPYIKENDEIIAYESIPMIHFLTKTKPYLGISWFISVSSSEFERRVSQKIRKKENNALPMVIRQKFETISRFGKPSDEYISDNRKNSAYFNNEEIRSFNSFLRAHNYEIVWKNSHFVLYSAPATETLGKK